MTGHTRRYYHERHGLKQPRRLDLAEARKLLASRFADFSGSGYFQSTLGYRCIDGDVSGTCGEDVAEWIYLSARLEGVHPFREHFEEFDEPTLFAVVELLFDLVSFPVSGSEHTAHDCGWHYNHFDQTEGRRNWRHAVNRILGMYATGFELSEGGEVRRLVPHGLSEIMSVSIPTSANPDNHEKIQAAVRGFLNARATRKERQDAVEDLVKVLEFLRPKVKQHMFRKDEDRLFEIANEFSLRHHSQTQKADYDPAWLDWMFYLYLSTTHLVLRLIEREPTSP